jgi:hypothetical protein
MSLTLRYSAGYHESKAYWVEGADFACWRKSGERHPCLVARCAGRGKGGALRNAPYAPGRAAQPGAGRGSGCAKLGGRLGVSHKVQVDPISRKAAPHVDGSREYSAGGVIYFMPVRRA